MHDDVTDSMNVSQASGDSAAIGGSKSRLNDYRPSSSTTSSATSSPSASPRKSALSSPAKRASAAAAALVSNGYNMRQRKVKLSDH